MSGVCVLETKSCAGPANLWIARHKAIVLWNRTMSQATKRSMRPAARVSPAVKRLPSQDGKHLRNALEKHLRAVPGRETQVTLKRPIKTC